MPTPMMTAQTRPEIDPSMRIPPSFRSRQTMSFGHLSSMPSAPVASRARAAATPDRKTEPLSSRLRGAESPEQRQADIASRSVHPDPTAASPTGPLVLTQTRIRAWQRDGPFHEPGIRGVDGAVYAQPSESSPTRQRGADPACVKRLDRGGGAGVHLNRRPRSRPAAMLSSAPSSRSRSESRDNR